MSHDDTAAAMQRYLDALAQDAPAEPIIRALLDRSIRRLDFRVSCWRRPGGDSLNRARASGRSTPAASSAVARDCSALKQRFWE